MAKIKGWYYDKQLESPLTSATLHANMWWDENQKKFINWNLIKGSNGFGTNGNQCDKDKYETMLGADKDACGYGLDPICTSILNEDFNIAISNTWSDFGGDPIGDLWNNIRGPMSAVAKPVLESIETLFENNKIAKASKENPGRVRRIMQNAVDWFAGKTENLNMSQEDIVSFLNKALVTNGTRFSYYGGTGIAFGNLGMRFTVFPKWKNKKFLEVPEQITKLYPYFIGQMEDFSEATGTEKPTQNEEGTTAGFVKEAANKCFMFQSPPGGYRTEMNSIDKIQKGTLKLKIGSFYEITNLVCSDVMLNFSKNMVKNPTTSNISPLFCDVAITLRPSTKYSDKMLKAFVGGSEEARNSIAGIIQQRLKNEKDNIDSAIKNQSYIIDQDV